MKHDLWSQPDQYSLIIPVTWCVNELEGFAEFVPDRGDAAIDVTFLKKTRISISVREDARILVEQFAAKNGLIPRSGIAFQACSTWWKCFGEYEADNKLSTPKYWVVCSVAGQTGAAIASLCCDELQSISYDEGVEMLKSLKYIKRELGVTH